MLGIKFGPGVEVVLKELSDLNTSIKSLKQERRGEKRTLGGSRGLKFTFTKS